MLLAVLSIVWLIATTGLVMENERLLRENKSYKEEVMNSKENLDYCLKEIKKLMLDNDDDEVGR
jgi:hypothetical protein